LQDIEAKVNKLKLKKIVILVAIPLSFLVVACSQVPYNSPMGGWGHMMNYGAPGGGLMWLILLVVIGVVIYFMFQASKNSGRSTPEAPLDILKQRYAKGEITKEEFDKMKTDIER
jgi:putative membrane protein